MGAPGENQPEKTALVLSAGGMFGAYQAGAYKTILEHFPIDLVVGASVGALNGWPIASRCTPEHLIERWLKPATANSLTLYPNPGWRNGWFDPKPLLALATDLYEGYRPEIPFGLVVTSVPTLQRPWFRTHLIQHPEVRPEHMQASCSIPFFLPTVTIGEHRFLDGGVFDKLPIAAALTMGATRIIAIDSLPNVGPAWVRRGVGIARLLKRDPRVSDDVDVTIISPSEALGSANDAVFWKESNIHRWVELGMRDAQAQLDGHRYSRMIPGIKAPVNLQPLA